MKKLVLVLVLVLAFALPVFANPFVDVPLNHWAYDSVQSLAAKGVIVGYPDGTFGGARSLTRYEFAEAVAKALAYVEGMDFASADDVAILEKLAIEFADELASLGVTVADLEASVGANSEAIAAMEGTVAKHEKFFEPLTISGDIEVTYEKAVYPTVGAANLKDQTELNFAAEINDTTTAGVELEFENIITANASLDIDSCKFWLKHYGEDLSLWIGNMTPDTIGLGLIYEHDSSYEIYEDFYGAWAQWNWGDDEDNDLGTWTVFMNVEDFYVLNVSFDLGDEEDIAAGITASYDPKALGYVAGVNLAFDLTDEDSDDQMALALEGGVFSDLTTTSFAVTGELTGTFGDDDDIDMYLDAWYVQPGFVPTNTDFDPDELGVEIGVGFPLTNDEDEVNIVAAPYWGYTMDSAMAAATDHYVGLKFSFANIDEDHPEEEAYVKAKYHILSGDIYVEGEYLNLILGDADEFVFNAYGDYTFATTPDYTAMANVTYSFEDDPIDIVLEGRLDSNGVAPYSVEAQLQYELAENTDLNVGFEMNDWDNDITDWSDDTYWNIIDDTTTVYAGILVHF